MAKLKFVGLDDLMSRFLTLENSSKDMIGKAVFDGAGIAADAVKAGIESLPIDERHFKYGQMLNGISRIQKAGLVDGFGISPMENDNGYNHVKLGFAGYNDVKTKSYPNGQPNSVIARSVNGGTSFRVRIPFVDNAVNSKKAAVENKMKETFDKELEKVVK